MYITGAELFNNGRVLAKLNACVRCYFIGYTDGTTVFAVRSGNDEYFIACRLPAPAAIS